MEAASLGVILDSSIVIEAERQHLDVAQFLRQIVQNAPVSSTGVTIPFDDLPIGSCALERGHAMATRSVRHFTRIPGLKVISF